MGQASGRGAAGLKCADSNHDVMASEQSSVYPLSMRRTPTTSITVSIPTWNRAKLLDQTLTQMRPLRIPSDVEWELLVVNNNCTDQTDEVIAKHEKKPYRSAGFSSRHPALASVNDAVTEARGEWILWTDDDVLVDPEWLRRTGMPSRGGRTLVILGG